jgi:hypothetical protein
LPQAPQLVGSEDVSTHVPTPPASPQAVVCGGHTQLPPVHCVPPVHALPHFPQLAELCCKLPQMPLQRSWPVGHEHEPAVQLVPPVHTMPQPPQFWLSLVVSTQAPVHSVWVAEQPVLHIPLLHTWLAAHLVPHPPQSTGLLARLTHCPEQFTVPVGHLHAPPEQKVPPEHVSPQPPQFALSFCMSTHALPHAVRLVAHWPWHTPELQNGVAAGQAFPHPPQLLGSVCSSAHEPEQ